MNNQRSNNTFKTVKMESLVPVEHQPTQTTPTVRPTTGKLGLEEVLQERVARVVQVKAGKADALARYNATQQYTPVEHWFSVEDKRFRLCEIERTEEGVMWVKAVSPAGFPWRVGIPEDTVFATKFFPN